MPPIRLKDCPMIGRGLVPAVSVEAIMTISQSAKNSCKNLWVSAPLQG